MKDFQVSSLFANNGVLEIRVSLYPKISHKWVKITAFIYTLGIAVFNFVSVFHVENIQ